MLMPMNLHIGGVVTDEENLDWAFCECGWKTGPSTDRVALWDAANEHSDPEALEQRVYDVRLDYPHLSRDEILNPAKYQTTNS